MINYKFLNNKRFLKKISLGFTLIELLVAVAIISTLVGIATFSLRQAQSAARDGKRKADLEEISIALELFKNDCGSYPASISLAGFGACPTFGNYFSTIPTDPRPPRQYFYNRLNPNSYILCASLENAPNPPVNTTGCGSCGAGTNCNWKISRP